MENIFSRRDNSPGYTRILFRTDSEVRSNESFWSTPPESQLGMDISRDWLSAHHVDYFLERKRSESTGNLSAF